MAVWFASVISNDIECELKSLEMAGRWRGDGWELPLAISNGCGCHFKLLNMAGRCLGVWHQLIPNMSVVIVNHQEMAGRWLGGWP